MLKSYKIYFDRLHHNNEDRKDRLSYENLTKKYKLSMLGIYYLFKKYETPVSIEKEERTKQKAENKYKSRLCECKICTEKERYIVKRDYERLEIERVSYNSLPYNEKLRDDKLYPK
ncbi:hypothetical protein AVEN_99892-1 [Araneus ventricosus]|uniref:Uncharacterized protein n=1 Tax=Araneus ventricosus TaxID=182803 RepID=A0A4Y2U9G9_ARAVE|nr:hypothetical protein AVEN_99892-1 [Araneus ventricosus]